MTTETIDLENRSNLPRQDNHDPALFGQTPWQTVGPFFHYGLPWKGGADLVGSSEMGARPELFPPQHYVLAAPNATGMPHGEVIAIAGRVLDGHGDPLPDALIEIWQANAAGRYASPHDPRTEIPLDPHFIGFGRAATDAQGIWRFRTIRPGCVPGPGNSLQAPHIMLAVLGRGLLRRLVTRLYFADSKENEADPILALVPQARRDTLIARKADDDGWWLDIVLQGDNETVFFAL